MDTASSRRLVVREIDGYALVRELGQGGMGRVFLARQKSLDRLVALKVLQPTLVEDAEFVERFHREAKAAALFQHPNVVGVIDRGQDPGSGVHYIAFEYLEGGSLQDRLEQRGRLPAREALTVIHGIAQALVYAESKGLVHRDVKPDNILFDRNGTPKLADLGLAREIKSEARVTQTGMVLGTPFYMAPEQALGEVELDVRADIYALGLCLWRCLTGLVPFDEEESASAMQILARHINQDLPDVRTRNAEVSDDVAALIELMAARERDERYGSAKELLADVARVLQGRPPAGPRGVSAVAPTAAMEAPAVRRAASGARRASSAGRPAVRAPSGRRPTPAAAPPPSDDDDEAGVPIPALVAMVVVALLLGIGLTMVFVSGGGEDPIQPAVAAAPAPGEAPSPSPVEPAEEAAPAEGRAPAPAEVPAEAPTEVRSAPAPGARAEQTDFAAKLGQRVAFVIPEARGFLDAGRAAFLAEPSAGWGEGEAAAARDFVEAAGAVLDELERPAPDPAAWPGLARRLDDLAGRVPAGAFGERLAGALKLWRDHLQVAAHLLETLTQDPPDAAADLKAWIEGRIGDFARLNETAEGLAGRGEPGTILPQLAAGIACWAGGAAETDGAKKLLDPDFERMDDAIERVAWARLLGPELRALAAVLRAMQAEHRAGAAHPSAALALLTQARRGERSRFLEGRVLQTRDLRWSGGARALGLVLAAPPRDGEEVTLRFLRYFLVTVGADEARLAWDGRFGPPEEVAPLSWPAGPALCVVELWVDGRGVRLEVRVVARDAEGLAELSDVRTAVLELEGGMVNRLREMIAPEPAARRAFGVERVAGADVEEVLVRDAGPPRGEEVLQQIVEDLQRLGERRAERLDEGRRGDGARERRGRRRDGPRERWRERRSGVSDDDRPPPPEGRPAPPRGGPPPPRRG